MYLLTIAPMMLLDGSSKCRVVRMDINTSGSDNTDLFPCELIDAQQGALNATADEIRRLKGQIASLKNCLRCCEQIYQGVCDDGEYYITPYGDIFNSISDALRKCGK